MNLIRSHSQACFLLACAALLALPSTGLAQVRTKKPDRGVYQPPEVEAVAKKPRQRRSANVSPRRSTAKGPYGDWAPVRQRRELVDVELDDLKNPAPPREIEPVAHQEPVHPEPVRLEPVRLEPVGHEQVVLTEPESSAINPGEPAQYTAAPAVTYHRKSSGIGGLFHSWTCDGCSQCAPPCDALGCETIGCDSLLHEPLGCGVPGCVAPGCGGCAAPPACDPHGCDSIGCHALGGPVGCDAIGCNCATCQGPAPWYHRKWTGPVLGISPGQWFGSAELLLLWRRGDRTPPLVTTGSDADPDTAGELGQPETRVLSGVDTILKDLTAGARFTFGMYLDRSHCHSLVFRSWLAGDEKYSFLANQVNSPVIARPFLNVTDGQPVEQDTFLVAFPGRATGGINVQAVSQLYGADIAIRQLWYTQCNHRVDVLYGYQFMRLNESLAIVNSSTSLDAAFAPVGSVISIADAFNAENEFHGAQFGLASRYREGCWSFDAIAKLAFGSLQRRAIRSGVTTTTNGGATAVDPNGLLVRSTNAGTVSDNTFGWMPELDFSIGYRIKPTWDVTFGYYIIGLSDALQVSGTIDPNLAVNLADPPTGQQRPSGALRFRSYYAQGIKFGIKHEF